MTVKDASGKTILFRYTIPQSILNSDQWLKLTSKSQKIPFTQCQMGSGIDSNGVFIAEIGMTHIWLT